MFKYYFEQVHNVALWPIISLSIFFTFFIGLIIWVWKVDKTYIEKMKNLPMDDSDEERASSFKVKLLLMPVLMLTGVFSSQAQSFGQSLSLSQEDLNMIVISMVLVVLFLVLLVAFYLLRILSIMVEADAQRKAEFKGVVYVKKPSQLATFWAGLTNAVPIEKEETIVLDHNYDGIRELDNHLPPWWTWLFNISIVFAVIYMLVYHVFDTLPLQVEEYEISIAEATAVAGNAGSAPVSTIDESNIVFDNDPTVLAEGLKIYTMNCTPCHKAGGEGGIGPNLTDEYWKHGGSASNTYNSIKNGIPDKGMIAWKEVLSPAKIYAVNAYIYTLRGTNPANAKAPEGDKYVEVVAE